MFIKSDKLNEIFESSNLESTYLRRIVTRVMYATFYLKNFVWYLPKYIFTKK
jgi:hypothetical protein